MRRIASILNVISLYGQAQVKPLVSQRQYGDQVNVVRLAPRYATAIRMPEPVSSVVVGDPVKFLAEHSEKEPTLVLVKPVVEEVAESNLLVITSKGKQISFMLKSEGAGAKAVDFVVNYRSAGPFLIEEDGAGTLEVPGTEPLRSASSPAAVVLPARIDGAAGTEAPEQTRDPLTALLDRQRRAGLPVLYGMRAPSPEEKSDYVKAGVSEVIDQGRQVLVLFSVVNPQDQAIEILSPQVQLAGMIETGALIKRKRWGSSEQLVVRDFRLSRRRLGAGERADGVLLFDRPTFKQSHETLFLQMAESGAVDKPALAPIGFGVSAIRKEVPGDE
jgi:hypothetical protein